MTTILAEQQSVRMDINELEDNLFLEFKVIVEDVSREINEKIVSQIVTTPLDLTLEKYEKQIPALTQSVDTIRTISSYFEKTKVELYNNLNKTISEISTTVIEETVLSRLEEVYGRYQKQLPLIDRGTSSLNALIENIKQTEREIAANVSGIVAEVSRDVLDNEVVNKFAKLLQDYTEQLPEMEKASVELKLMVEQVEEARENIYKHINETYTIIFNKITNVIQDRLNELYLQYKEQVAEIGKLNFELKNSVEQINHNQMGMVEVADMQMKKIGALQKEVDDLKEQTRLLNKKLDEDSEKQSKMMYFVYGITALSFFGLFI